MNIFRILLVLLAVSSLTYCQSPTPQNGDSGPSQEYDEGFTDGSLEWDEAKDGPGLVVNEEIEIPLTNPKSDGSYPPIYEDDDVDKFAGEIRAVTWNIRQQTPGTNAKPITYQLPGQTTESTTTKGPMIFKSLKAFGAHVAALQEVYNETPAKPRQSLSPSEGYEVLYGNHIKRNRRQKGVFQYEFCPIAYRPDVLECSEGETDPSALTHWASCTIKDMNIQFYFGCSHLSTRTNSIKADLRKLVDNIAREDNPPSTKKPTVSASKDGQFILGLDANSHPEGKSDKAWDGFISKWDKEINPPGQPPAQKKVVTIPGANSQGLVSKVYKRKNKNPPPSHEVKVSKTAGRRFIDFFIFRLIDRLHYKETAVMNVQLLNTSKSGQDLLLWYYDISDHLPVRDTYVYPDPP